MEGVEALQRADDGPFRFGEPIFAFIDPFGAKGMPFAVVRDLLMRKTVEVLAIPSVRYVFLPGERTTQIDLAPTMHSRPQLVTVTMRSCRPVRASLLL